MALRRMESPSRTESQALHMQVQSAKKENEEGRPEMAQVRTVSEP